MVQTTGFSAHRRKPKVGTLTAIVLLHVAIVYGLARAFAPGAVASVERSVVSAFTVTVETKETPPAPEPEPDAGASGEEGRRAVPRPVVAPPPRIPIAREQPAPKASSTGTANDSGAREQGSGTGAGGEGSGTGSGAGGGGQGGGIATQPVHVSGRIDDARDYPAPPGGRDARRGDEVVVRVVVGTDGRASNCTIFRPSPDPEADRITCLLVVDRLRFRAATDSAGSPVAAPFYWRQRWF